MTQQNDHMLVPWHIAINFASMLRQPHLVGGLVAIFGIFPYIGNNHPNWRTHIFQRGSNHQPAMNWNCHKTRFSNTWHEHDSERPSLSFWMVRPLAIQPWLPRKSRAKIIGSNWFLCGSIWDCWCLLPAIELWFGGWFMDTLWHWIYQINKKWWIISIDNLFIPPYW